MCHFWNVIDVSPDVVEDILESIFEALVVILTAVYMWKEYNTLKSLFPSRSESLAGLLFQQGACIVGGSHMPTKLG